MELAARFHKLFSGYDKAYGFYEVDKSTTGKRKGKRATLHQAVTESVWEKHLTTTTGIGVVPLRDDGTVLWAAIDVDYYDGDQGANLRKMEAAVLAQGLPFAVCRTKSGGIHLYVFFKAPASAPLVRRKLAALATFVGFEGSEVFPKQDAHDIDNSVGNWVNMPYAEGAATDRFCIHNEAVLTPEQFLDYAESIKISETDFLNIDTRLRVKDEFEGAPPCIKALVKDGFPKGSMNNGLFNLGVYAKKSRPSDYEKWIRKWNQEFLGPGTEDEVQNVLRSVNKVDYEYLCKEEPISLYCDEAACSHCEHGRDDGGSTGFNLDRIVKIDSDPPVYFVTVNGSAIKMSAEVLTHPGRFALKVFERLNYLPPQLKANRWTRMLNKAMANVEVKKAPDNASPVGQLWEYLEEFCTGRAQAKVFEEVLTGRAYHDKEDGVHCFRGKDVMEFLKKKQFFEFKRNEVYALIRKRGGKDQFKNIKGKGVSYLTIPEFTEQSESFDVQIEKEQF